nr:hypothetical protein OG461_01030 [Streptomyces sp. NBC_00995]
MPPVTTPPPSGREEAAVRLLPEVAHQSCTVVAGNAMNRKRGLHGVNGCTRELRFDPLDHLSARPITLPGRRVSTSSRLPSPTGRLRGRTT